MTLDLAASFAIRATVLMVAGGVVVLSNRKANASERHLIWMLTIASLAVLPVVTYEIPALRVIPIPATLRADLARPLGVDPSFRHDTPVKLDLVYGLFAVWAFGALVTLARLARAHRRARLIVDGSRENEALSKFLRHPVRVSNDARFPFSYGIGRAVVVLPAESARWSSVQMLATLAHEGAHISRNDGLSLFLSQLIVAMYWWHPGAWLVASFAAAERERACDDAVLRSGIKSSEYASHLLGEGNHLLTGPSRLATALLSHSDGLGARVSRILDLDLDRRVTTPRRQFVATVIALPVVAAIASASPIAGTKATAHRLDPVAVQPVSISGATTVEQSARAKLGPAPRSVRDGKARHVTAAPSTNSTAAGKFDLILRHVNSSRINAAQKGKFATGVGRAAKQASGIASEWTVRQY